MTFRNYNKRSGHKALMEFWASKLSELAHDWNKNITFSEFHDAITKIARRSCLPYAWSNNTDYERENGYLEIKICGYILQVFLAPPDDERDRWTAILYSNPKIFRI